MKSGIPTEFSGLISPKIPENVFFDMDDFACLPVTAEGYTITQKTAGTATLVAAGENGQLILAPGAADDDKGMNLQRTASMVKPKAGRQIIWEAYITNGTVNTGDYFIGLSEIDTTIITAAGGVTTSNHLGFSSVTGDGVVLANAKKAGTGTTATAYTMGTASAWTKLKIVVNGVTSADFYVNGALVKSVITDYVPIVSLAPSLVCQGSGTGTPTLTIDYWTVQQTR